MREVTKDQFYKYIGPMNVFGRIVNNKWPYETHMILQTNSHQVVAKRVGYLVGPFEHAKYYKSV